MYHLPLVETGGKPEWGDIAELFTLHKEPINRSTNFDISIGVSDVLEAGPL